MKSITKKIRKNIIDDILKVVSIQSYTKNGIKNCQQEIIRIAEKLGFQTKLLGKDKVIIIEPKQATEVPKLGILTHLDTVPFKESEWTYNPLGELNSDRIYGRGVLDDKGPIILALYAFYMLENSIRPSWQIIVGSAEESDWEDMKDYLEEGHTLPKFSITIDGDGIQNGCKGYLDLEVKFQRDSEKTQISELFVPNGVVNIVPEKAIAIINASRISKKGVAAHSSIPQEGENALIELTQHIQNRFEITEFSGFFQMMNILNKSLNGTAIGFPERQMFFDNQFVGYTTVCPTTCLLEEDCLSVNLNIRLSIGTTKADVHQAIEEISSRFNCECHIEKLELPVYVTQHSEEISMLKKAYEFVMNTNAPCTIANGIGYNATIPNCIIFGPRFSAKDDERDTCHAVNENREIDDLFKFFRMLLIFCNNYLS